MSQSPDAIIIKARVAPNEIGYLNAQLDACEGIAVIRTVDPQEGRVVFWVSPDFMDEFHQFIRALQEEIRLELEPT